MFASKERIHSSDRMTSKNAFVNRASRLSRQQAQRGALGLPCFRTFFRTNMAGDGSDERALEIEEEERAEVAEDGADIGEDHGDDERSPDADGEPAADDAAAEEPGGAAALGVGDAAAVGGGAEGGVGAFWMAALAAPNLASDALSALHARKRALRVERERVAKQLRYEERKRDRLLGNLVSLMAGRAQARAKAASKAKGKNP